MSEGVTPEAVTTNILDDLLTRGLDIVLSTDPKKGVYKDLRQTILSSFPEVIIGRLEFLSAENQGVILEGVLKENPNLFISEDSWSSYVNKAIERIHSMNPDSFFHHTGLYVLLNRIKDLREEVNWMDIFNKLSLATIDGASKCQGFSTVINWLISADVENLRKILHNTDSKSYPAELKMELYHRAIDFGIFDVKLARRVRSDSSGTLSSNILSYLFENRHIYSDDIFQDLVTQFSDTKHKWVARYIAINMPMHLVPFLMGIKDDVALKILEKRMEVMEDA